LPLIDFIEIAKNSGREVPFSSRPVVCVQGLGFVGSAMATVVACSKNEIDELNYNVIGIEQPSESGHQIVEAINKGRFPIVNRDNKLLEAFSSAYQAGNLIATTDPVSYKLASITIVDIHLDIDVSQSKPSIDFSGFKQAIGTLGEYMSPGSLIIIETTVPPGTCEKIVVPILKDKLKGRNLSEDSILLAHSYERVMPGSDYFDSIVNFWKVYSGRTSEAANACESFFNSVINTNEFPLTRLHSTTASETAKILENSYRAVNIAFIEEWGRFAEAIGVDLFEVIQAIRVRPTHNNMRQPGFGVGGYCLTKDPIAQIISADEFYGLEEFKFPFSSMAMEVNKSMPSVTLKKVQMLLGGSFAGKKFLLLGISYRPEVGDTRFSPSETFVRLVRENGGEIISHDPVVTFWEELGVKVDRDMPSPEFFDAVILAVPHSFYKVFDYKGWLGNHRPLIFDSNNVLSSEQRGILRNEGVQVASIGRGDGL
jgi:UDP-N-acetyl-D-glucosamine dehydrogenase